MIPAPVRPLGSSSKRLARSRSRPRASCRTLDLRELARRKDGSVPDSHPRTSPGPSTGSRNRAAGHRSCPTRHPTAAPGAAPRLEASRLVNPLYVFSPMTLPHARCGNPHPWMIGLRTAPGAVTVLCLRNKWAVTREELRSCAQRPDGRLGASEHALVGWFGPAGSARRTSGARSASRSVPRVQALTAPSWSFSVCVTVARCAATVAA
jgi:hypothetical protein